MKIKINVTTEDIRCGIKGHSGSCAIALACRRLGFLPQVTPGNIELACEKSGKAYRALTPQVAADFIAAFDTGGVAEPLRFTIEAEKV